MPDGLSEASPVSLDRHLKHANNCLSVNIKFLMHTLHAHFIYIRMQCINTHKTEIPKAEKHSSLFQCLKRAWSWVKPTPEMGRCKWFVMQKASSPSQTWVCWWEIGKKSNINFFSSPCGGTLFDLRRTAMKYSSGSIHTHSFPSHAIKMTPGLIINSEIYRAGEATEVFPFLVWRFLSVVCCKCK